MNIPVTAAALGSIISVPLALIGLGSAISKCTIEVQKEDGDVINVNEMVTKTFIQVRRMMKTIRPIRSIILTSILLLN